jgi:hypothetical protein
MSIDLFCKTPTLLNETELAVEFWQKNYFHPLGCAIHFKQAANLNEIWLIIKGSAAAAICLAFIGAAKLPIALCLQL